MIEGIVFISCLVFAGLLFMGFFLTVDAEHNLISWKVPYTIFSIAVLILVVLLGYSLWSHTEREYPMHDVIVRIYYIDGSQEILHLEQISQDLPRIDSRFRSPYLITGKGSIPYIDRFDIIDEGCYTMKGSDFKCKK